MKTFSLATVAKIIGISKSTLRYYDKLDLLIPKRADNQYRFYNEQDLIYLKYIQVLKHNGCSLTEIRELLSLYEFSLVSTGYCSKTALTYWSPVGKI